MAMSQPVAIITGSTSGIGLAIAKTLTAQNYRVVLNGLGDQKAIERLVHGFTEQGANVDFDPADMGKPEEVTALIQNAHARHGRVDVLVNNAGVQFTARTEHFPVDKWNDILAINLSAAFHATRAVLPFMQKHEYGRIINIASVHGLVASVDKVAYVAAKHGLIGLTKVVALENAERNITCNAICPGWVRTPLVEKQIQERAARMQVSIEQAQRDLLAEKQPSLRFTSVEDVASTVLFLSGSAGGNVNGTTITLDGGWTAR
jgi:3-hydroxybutyrate dehydrogenase